MKEALPGETESDVIRRKCKAMVDYAKSHKWEGPPFCPKILAGIHGVTVEETGESFDGEGRIFPRRGRVVIQIKKGGNIERRRFTICHELAHTCFPDVYEFVRHYGSSIGEEEHKRFENLCDVGAGELLMPHLNFLSDIQSSPLSLAMIESLGRRYTASIDAALKRALDVSEHPCAAAFLTNRGFKEFPAVRNRMRIKYFWKSRSFVGFPRPGTLVPGGITPQSAPATAIVAFPKSRETWWINHRPYSWYVELLRLPVIPENQDYPQVVALLHSRKPVIQR